MLEQVKTYLLETLHFLAKITNYNGEIRWDTSKPDGTPKKLLDISRIKNLGWEPIISLEKGLRTTYFDFCKRNRKRK